MGRAHELCRCRTMLWACLVIASVSFVSSQPDPLGRKTTPDASACKTSELVQPCANPAPTAGCLASFKQEAVHLRLLVRKLLSHVTNAEKSWKQSINVNLQLAPKNLTALWKFLVSDGVDGLEDATEALAKAIVAAQISLTPPSSDLDLLTQYAIWTHLVLLIVVVLFLLVFPFWNHMPPPSTETDQGEPTSDTAWQKVHESIGAIETKVQQVKQAITEHHDGILDAIECARVRPAPQTSDAASQTGDDDGASGSSGFGQPVQEDDVGSKDASANWRISRLEHASLVVANLDVSVKFYRKLGVVADGMERSKRTLHLGNQKVYLVERGQDSCRKPVHGQSDIGLIVEVPYSQTVSHLQKSDIKIERELPDCDRDLGVAKSILVQDPDGYLVELVHYEHKP